MTTDRQAVIVGGGIMGVSLAYHLTRRGWRDIVLLEKSELTAGSTWHAAGLCTHFAHNPTIMEMRAASVRLYRDVLPAETGETAGFHPCGALRVTRSAERMAEFRHVQGLGQFVGREFRILTPEELARIYPLARMDGLLGAIHEPNDGHVDPTLATHALAAGARSRGAEIRRHEPVQGIERSASGAWVIHTGRDAIRSEHVVNAAGTWCREIGAMMGVDLPVVPMLHQYLVTAEVPEVTARIAAGDPELPIIRDPEESWYLRQERDGFIVGPYEADGRPWGVDGIPPEFGMELLPPELDRVEPIVRDGHGAGAGARAGRHQDHRQRADHVHTGRESARRSRFRPRARLAAGGLEHGSDGRRRRRALPRRLDGRRRPADGRARNRSPAIRRIRGP